MKWKQSADGAGKLVLKITDNTTVRRRVLLQVAFTEKKVVRCTVSEVQDPLIGVLEPVRRPESLPDAEDAEQTTDAGVDRPHGFSNIPTGCARGWRVRLSTNAIRSIGRWGEEEETEEEKVVECRVRRRGVSERRTPRSGLSACSILSHRRVVPFISSKDRI